jgi:F5/8 type C domain
MTISIGTTFNPDNSRENSTSEQKNLGLGLATLALSISSIPNAQAALITGVTASTDMGTFDPIVNINDVANGSGLSALSLTATHSEAEFGNAWGSDVGTTTGNITFNLGGQYSLAGFSLWNFNPGGASPSGINGVNIQTSTDGTTFTNVAGAPTQFAIASSLTAEPAQQFSFAPVNAAFVRFNVLSNHGNTQFTGLDEVQFNSAASATAVPEPLTILGTLTAIGGGAALKRRLKGLQSK